MWGGGTGPQRPLWEQRVRRPSSGHGQLVSCLLARHRCADVSLAKCQGWGVIRAWEQGGSLGTAQTGEASSLLWGVGLPALRPCPEPRPYAVPVLLDSGWQRCGVWMSCVASSVLRL